MCGAPAFWDVRRHVSQEGTPTVLRVRIRTKRDPAALCRKGARGAEEDSSSRPEGEWGPFRSTVLSSHVPDTTDGESARKRAPQSQGTDGLRVAASREPEGPATSQR